MGFRQKLSKATGIRAEKLPAGYQLVGDVLLLKLPKIRVNDKRKIAEAVLPLLPNVRTVCEIREIKGEFRTPVIEKLAGDGTLTIHKENDILYRIDASQIMFSKGNLSERKRLLSQVKDDENIVDMFAGIGYFSLALAKFTNAREILAIEKNPLAYNLLIENIELNKVTKINAIQGDCKMAASAFKNFADRIVMGYFPGTEEFLPHALYMARPGCVVHYHNVYKESELWKKPLQQIENLCTRYGIVHKVLAKKRVKSFAPRVWHVVVDFQVLGKK